MANTHIIARPDLLGVFSFTTGFVASPPQKPKGEEEILRHALWLQNQGRMDEALAYIDRHCQRRS